MIRVLLVTLVAAFALAGLLLPGLGLYRRLRQAPRYFGELHDPRVR